MLMKLEKRTKIFKCLTCFSITVTKNRKQNYYQKETLNRQTVVRPYYVLIPNRPFTNSIENIYTSSNTKTNFDDQNSCLCTRISNW